MLIVINTSNLQDVVVNPANKYMVIANNSNTKKRCEICSVLTVKHQNDVIDVILMP